MSFGRSADVDKKDEGRNVIKINTKPAPMVTIATNEEGRPPMIRAVLSQESLTSNSSIDLNSEDDEVT